MMNRRSFLSAAMAAGAGAVLPQARAAQWPVRPVNLVIPFVAGGPVDVAGRTISEPLAAGLGQPVVVVNKAGAGGNIGASTVARAGAEGYDFLLALDSIITVNPVLYPDAGFSPAKDLAPVGMVGELASVLVVNARSDIRSTADFVSHARAQSLTFGSGGNGTAGHLYGEVLKHDFGLKMEHIPYKGLAPAVQDLLAGNIDCIIALIPGVLGQIRAGALRPLGLTSARPQSLLPDLQPLSSQGLDGFEGSSWLPVMASAAAPASAVTAMGDQLRHALELPDTARQLQQRGIEPVQATAQEVGDRIRREAGRWHELLAKISVRG